LIAPFEIATGIYLLCSGTENNSPNYNSYLLVGKHRTLLIDPGSISRIETTKAQLDQISSSLKIDYLLFQNHAPCVCSSLSWFEENYPIKNVIFHERALDMMKAYNYKSDAILINNDVTSFSEIDDWKLHFIETPYIPYLESFVTYIEEEQILFSSSIFGGMPRKWKPFADKIFYKESVKSFHEQFISDTSLLRPVIDTLQKLKIKTIAPHIGSVIVQNIDKLMETLKRLKCGIYHNPIKNDITKKEGYISLCNSIIEKLSEKVNPTEIRALFDNTELVFDQKRLILTSANGSGEEIWEKFFTHIYTIKGGRWLALISEMVKDYIKRFHVIEPTVFNKREQEIIRIDNENILLRQQNELLEQARNNLLLCSITGLNNEAFFKSYLQTEIESHKNNKEDFALLHIEIDKFADIRLKYGLQGGTIKNQTLQAITYLIEQLKDKQHQLLKWSEDTFALFLPNSSIEEGKKIAEKIRYEAQVSDVFPEQITLSVGVSCLSEFREDKQTENEIIRLTELKTLNAKKMGMNRVSAIIDEGIGTGKQSILIVEKDDLNSEMLIINLSELGYNIFTCSDGHEALGIIEKENIDLVIAELLLPKLNGFALREHMLLDSNKKSIPCILLSHQKDDETIKQAYELSIDAFLKKPYKMSELKGITVHLLKNA